MIRPNQSQPGNHLHVAVLLGAMFFLFSCGGSGEGGVLLSKSESAVTNTSAGINTSTSSGIGFGLGFGFDISGSGISRGAKFDISGSGITRSRIDRFGSIIINGREYDTGSASFNDDGNQLATQADLNTDQVVTVHANFDELTAVQVDYRSSIKGPIDSLVILAGGEGGIISLGQTIRSDVSTNFENTERDALRPGDLIEVSGIQDEAGDIVASFVELKPVLANYKLVGKLTNVTADSFNIGSLIVNFSAASLKNFPNGLPEEGQTVQVTSDPVDYSPPDRLIASSVEFFIPSLGIAGSSVELEGYVTSFTSIADFEISGFPVTTLGSETDYLNGTTESLTLGVKVEVNGSLNENGVLEASGVIVKPTNDVRYEGSIDSIDLQTNLISALGVSFEVRSGTRLEDKSDADLENIALADFSVGDRVKLRGYLDGSGLVATRIEREDLDDDVRFRGLVNRENEVGGTLEVLGVLITPDVNITEFENRDGLLITQAEFHSLIEPGSIVKAKWDVFTSVELAPDSLQIE